MAQKTSVGCDRCGRDIIGPSEISFPAYLVKEHSAKINLWPVGEPRSSFGQRIDLCTECYEKFVSFMEDYTK